jgi:hypothetical protein
MKCIAILIHICYYKIMPACVLGLAIEWAELHKDELGVGGIIWLK